VQLGPIGSRHGRPCPIDKGSNYKLAQETSPDDWGGTAGCAAPNFFWVPAKLPRRSALAVSSLGLRKVAVLGRQARAFLLDGWADPDSGAVLSLPGDYTNPETLTLREYRL
jgi:hypothetical protein